MITNGRLQKERVLENLSGERIACRKERAESREEMPSVMSKRTVAVMAELDEKTKTKKPRVVVAKHDGASLIGKYYVLSD